MIREIERFKRVYCGKEEIHIVLNKHIEENKHSFFPREEFLAYKEKVEGTNTVIMGAVDSSNKMMRTIDKEFKEINQTLHNKPDRSEFKKL